MLTGRTIMAALALGLLAGALCAVWSSLVSALDPSPLPGRAVAAPLAPPVGLPPAADVARERRAGAAE